MRICSLVRIHWTAYAGSIVCSEAFRIIAYRHMVWLRVVWRPGFESLIVYDLNSAAADRDRLGPMVLNV